MKDLSNRVPRRIFVSQLITDANDRFAILSFHGLGRFAATVIADGDIAVIEMQAFSDRGTDAPRAAVTSAVRRVLGLPDCATDGAMLVPTCAIEVRILCGTYVRQDSTKQHVAEVLCNFFWLQSPVLP